MANNANRFQVEFQGRFMIERHQITSEVAFNLLDKCIKKKHLKRTTLKVTDDGFYVGTRTGIVQIKRKTFRFDLIERFYVFKNDQKCVVLVNTSKEKFFMSLIKFANPYDLTKVLDLVEDRRVKTNGSVARIDSDEDEAGGDLGSFGGDLGIFGCVPQYLENEEFERDMGSNDEVDEPVNLNVIDDREERQSAEGRYPSQEQDSRVPAYEREEVDIIFPEEPAGNGISRELIFPGDGFVGRHSKINNMSSATFDDLFNENPSDNQKEVSEVFEGSRYMFVNHNRVPVEDLFGICESDVDD